MRTKEASKWDFHTVQKCKHIVLVLSFHRFRLNSTCSCGINHSWYQAVRRTQICDNPWPQLKRASLEYVQYIQCRFISFHPSETTSHDFQCANNCNAIMNVKHIIGLYFNQFNTHTKVNETKVSLKCVTELTDGAGYDLVHSYNNIIFVILVFLDRMPDVSLRCGFVLANIQMKFQ